MSIKLEVQWSPVDPNIFITSGSEILLYEVQPLNEINVKSCLKLSDNTVAEVISTNTSQHYIKCVEICPRPGPPLLAVGLANGKVSLTTFGPQDHVGLAGKEFVPRHARQCTALDWNRTEPCLLAVGLDKCRAEHCITVWDLEGTTPVELGLSESAHSLCWLQHSKTLLAGMNQKHLKMIDFRHSLKNVSATGTKAVYGVCVDPNNDKQVASYIDNIIAIWDLRAFDKPIATMSQSKIVTRISWCPTRSNLLGSLHRDSPLLYLHDIRRTLLGGDDWEPVVQERAVHPVPMQMGTGNNSSSNFYGNTTSLSSFSWHPEHENRLLAINIADTITDYWLCERIALNFSSGYDLMWSCSRQFIRHISADRDGKNDHESDISCIIKRRALAEYGLKPDLDMNANISEDENLSVTWQWLALAQTLPQGPGGVRASLRLDDSYAVMLSEVMLTPWPDFPQANGVKMYRSEVRETALQLCGWDSGVLDRLVLQHQYSRSATIAVFQLKVKTAIDILNTGAEKFPESGLHIMAMALSGFSVDRGLWRQMCAHARAQLQDPYLRAIFAFLTAEFDNYDAVLNETGIAVADRVGFACTFLPDVKLSEYLKQLTVKLTEEGDLAGLLLTGTSLEGVSLLQSYLDATGDVQTVSLIAARTFPTDLLVDGQVQDWINSYRMLLDSWSMWTQRALFDIVLQCRSPNRPPQSVYVSCNFCGKSLSAYMQGSRGRALQRMPGTAKAKVAIELKMSACPNCRKPLPRCAICLMHMGTASGDSPIGTGIGSGQPQKSVEFDNWFTWCQTCRHGGHAKHMSNWFREHIECPVTSCSCRCFSVDSIEMINK